MITIQLASLKKDKIGSIFEIEKNIIDDYLKQPGVWAMKGKVAGTNQFEYLEIGQSNDIGKELKSDLNLLMLNYSAEKVEKRYTARRLFPEFQNLFEVCKCDKDRTAAKYRTISVLYSEIIIELIGTDPCRSNREKIEMQFAIDNKAKYWNAWGLQRREARSYYFKHQHRNLFDTLTSE